MLRNILLSLILVLLFFQLKGQCDPTQTPPLSPRIANYDIDLTLDHKAKTVEAREVVTWINTSPDTLREIRMYMYLNSFKNTKSTFLKGAGRVVFGDDMARRGDGTWGYVEVEKINRLGDNGVNTLTNNKKYIQPDDGNPHDESVLQVLLDEAVLPGDTLVLDMDFTARLPKIIARAGYSRDDYFLFVHWFPQMGVYEKDPQGNWGWNCHQFHRSTEFYSDFGVYDVKVTASDHLVMGSSGCMVDEKSNGDGTTTRHFRAEDVIDFAWTAYPHFKVFTETWEDVTIRLLIPEEHSMHVPRYFASVSHSLEYFRDHLGAYPYPMITVVDPPLHGLRSGFMEYPTLITTGSFYRMPKSIRTLESLAVHEFAHQYFMGMLASNEKEEAWLDEGLVTYFEDRIMDHYYGPQHALFDFLGYGSGNKEKTRLEYTGLPNPKVAIVALPGWEIRERAAFKGLIYAKTATTLQTLQAMVGDETMDEILRTYFDRWKFKHPRGRDLFDVVNEVVTKRHDDTFGKNLDWFFEQCLYETEVCDYAVGSINSFRKFSGQGLFDDGSGNLIFQKGSESDTMISTATLYRYGELIFPVEIEIQFSDGTMKTVEWSGEERRKELRYEGMATIVSAHIDPKQKIYLDINLNNNSYTLQPKKSALAKYAAKVAFWMQNIFQTVGFLV